MIKVIANWTYTPKDYFSSEISSEETDYSIKINEGKVELIINQSDNESIVETHSKYSGLVKSFFMAELLISRKIYELKVSTLKSQNEDGTLSIYLKPKTARFYFTPSIKVSFKKFNKDDKVIFDSEEEKKKKQIELLKKLQNALNKDENVQILFDSYKNSIADRENELVHLYEIRDGLHSYFGSHKNALKALSMTAKEWLDLGRICNDPELLQGRHRGRRTNTLRNATEDELKLAREISIKMIESFIGYLNK